MLYTTEALFKVILSYEKQEDIKMSGKSKQFDKMKYEIANEIGVNLKDGYNGDLSSKDAGSIGGNIVKKVFETYTGNNYYQGKKSGR